jgi:hypothetical protein
MASCHDEAIGGKLGMNRIILAFLLTANIPLALEAQGNVSGDCSALVDRAFQLAGVNDMVAAFPGQIQAQLDAQLKRNSSIDTAGRLTIADVFRKAFSVEKLGRGMKLDFLESCNPEMLKAVIAGLTNPLGTKMRKLEVAGENAQDSPEMAAYADGLSRVPPPQARVVLILRIDTSLGISDFAIETTLAGVKGMASAFGGTPINANVESSMKAQVAEPIRKSTLINLLFTYRDASDEELAQYVALNETAPFKQFNSSFRKAFLDTIAQQSIEAGSDLKKAMDGPRTLRP